jgi:Immune inhibitor A-like, MAM domain
MMKTNSGTILVGIIAGLFLITSLMPITDSIALTDTDTTYSSIPLLGQQQNNGNERLEKRTIDGLAPKTRQLQKASSYQIRSISRGYFLAYNAYDPSGQHQMGPITFETPDAIDLLAPGVFPNFCGGADIDVMENWYGCDYAGGLYSIDRMTGTQTFIGSSIGVNGMTYDSTTGTWYVTSSNNLYSMDVTSGATTLIGAHGVSNTFIGLACDLDGDMYGYDVLWTGDSTLYSIDKTTGAATAVGSMGYGFVYAQDCGFDRDNNILYIAGYFNDGTPSALLTCDISTGACTIVGSFEGGMEVDGLAIPWMGCCEWDHDIAINSILQPINGAASPIVPVVKVKNTGLNTESNITVQFAIGKEFITGIVEDFEATDGGYTHAPKLPQPDAWAWGAPTSGPMAAHSGFNVWATNPAGNYPPSMWCYLVTAPFTVPGDAMFNFWHWYYFETNYDGGNVKISNDGGVNWTLITPVGSYPGFMLYNPFMTGQACYNGQSGGWKQANFDLSAYEGQLVQIMFETASDSSVQYAGWYIDDVGFTSTSWVNEYTQTADVSSIASEEIVELSFPTWTPSDLGLIENNNLNYKAEATNLYVDENPNNDYKEKLFTLHYGYFHDVAVVDIISPVSGLAKTQTPEVMIENHGQNSESVNVQMTIGKTQYTTFLEEDFTGGVPPEGWGTNYPENWMSSSTNYAGGTAPEAEFSWTPSSVGEHLLYTGTINTTGYTALLLKFKEFVNDYNSNYLLKVVTSTDGGITWQDAYVRAGGPYGPATTEVALTEANGIGSATFQIAWDMSGDSFNINYWYIDDVWMGIIDMVEEYNQTISVNTNPGETLNVLLPDWTPEDIPFATTIDYLINTYVSMNTSDGNPADNHQSKLITLQYEHDVGVLDIYFDIYEPYNLNRQWIIWDNYADDGTGTGLSSQLDVDYPFNSQCTDDFQFSQSKDITGVHWWGIFWNGVTYPNPAEFNVIFYADDGSGTMPTGAGMDDPTSTALAVYNFPAVTGVSYGTNKYEYDVTLDPAFVAYAYEKYWIAIQAVFPFTGNGQWGFATNGANPDQLSGPVQGFPILGTPYWTPTTYGDHAFQLSGQNHYETYWYPGTYSIEGLIKNFGVIYSETDILVNTKIIFYGTGETIYDEDVVLPGSIEPGHVALASFPNVTFPNEQWWEGWYKLEMKTMLPNDDNPTNDKKTLTFYIHTIYDPPPHTDATISGTMGENGWYVSNVTVLLRAWDYKWPHGVNYTMYKIDHGDWIKENYSEEGITIIISTDGDHTVYFYSVDFNGNVETEHSVYFVIDQTDPSITMSAEKVGFQQWRFTANVSDETSGIEHIECYVDDIFLGPITAPGPYEWIWNGKGEHTVTGHAYDVAGNSATNAVVISYSFKDYHQQPRILTFLEKIIQMILSHLPFSLNM